MPTRKLLASTVLGIAGVLTMWATTGSWDAEETIAIIGVSSGFSVGWLVPNDPANPAS